MHLLEMLQWQSKGVKGLTFQQSLQIFTSTEVGYLRPVEIRMAEHFQVFGSGTYLLGKYSSLFGGPIIHR